MLLPRDFKLAAFVLSVCAVPQFILAYTLKETTAPTAKPFPRSVVPKFSVRFHSNSSRIATATAGVARPSASQTGDRITNPLVCLSNPCKDPVRIPNVQRPPIPSRTNDSLLPELKQDCPLWDGSCSGNRTAATVRFFKEGGTRDLLFSDKKGCFMNESAHCSPAVASEFARIKKWMRTPQCISTMKDFGLRYENSSYDRLTCCHNCFLSAGNVDVYYWPDPDPNTSCLDVVGSTIYPPDHGATTISDQTYLGCTTQVPGFGKSTITTAIVTYDNSVLVKRYLINPWSPQPCPETAATPVSTTRAPSPAGTLHASGHPLVIPSSVAHRNGTKVSTAVSGTFTLLVIN